MRTLFHFFQNKPVWINDLANQTKIIFEERKSPIVIISLCATLLYSCVINYKNNNLANVISSQNARNVIISREINDIKFLLHDIESNPLNTQKQQEELQSLEKKIDSTQKSMTEVAKSTEVQNISNQISSVKDDFDSRLSDLKKTMSEGNGNKEFLSSDSLPFHVISIDVIAGQSYVSIDFEHHISPLSIGDMLAGWQLITADSITGTAEFKNETNQFIKISLYGTAQ